MLFCAYLSPMNVNAENETPAIEIVEQLHAVLLNNMKNSKTLGLQGRYDALSPLIDQSFDFPLIAKVILSHHWDALNNADQTLFIETLTDLTKTTYAARFDEYTDETFNTVGTETLRKSRLLIRTEIQSTEEDLVSLNYLVHPVGDAWKIISVIANGVNDLSLKRAEYSTIIREHGFPSLIDQINKKIEGNKNL